MKLCPGSNIREIKEISVIGDNDIRRQLLDVLKESDYKSFLIRFIHYDEGPFKLWPGSVFKVSNILRNNLEEILRNFETIPILDQLNYINSI